jgi:hypothetical protein
MSDFIYSQQCDELIDGQYFDGQYVPTEQDLVDMAETWDDGELDYNYDYMETESDVYQDLSYDDEPNGWSDHLEGYGCDD